MPDLYIINIKPRHWEICRKDTIFGIPRGAPTPFRAEGRWKKGDICLVRGTAPNYGIKAIWYLDSEKRIKSRAENPWKDFDCEWLVQLRPLVEFKTRFSEEFETKRKYSPKVDMFASRFYRSISSRTIVLGNDPSSRRTQVPILFEWRSESPRASVELPDHENQKECWLA